MPLQVYSWLDRLCGNFLPPRCVLCRGIGQRPRYDLCRHCADDLPWLLQPCPRCGLPLPEGSGAESALHGCGHCATRQLPYSRCFAPCLYEFPLSQMILDLKYEAAMANARVLGVLLGESISRQRLQAAVDVVVPMPLHVDRLLERGFNQSYEIARFAARELGLACEPGLLRRCRPTRPQVGLAREERIDNVRGAFRAEGMDLGGRCVALLDDVVTTGSTVAEAARALLEAGAGRVDVWAVARAPG